MSFGYIGDTSTSVKQQVKNKGILTTQDSFDLEQRLQSEDRAHRISQTKNVTYIDIECQKSIDSKIIKALRDKKNIADIITKDPISIFLEEQDNE